MPPAPPHPPDASRDLIGKREYSSEGGEAVTTSALILVLVSAVIHAGWNLATKKAEGGAAYVFLMAAGSALCWFPLAAWLLMTGNTTTPGASPFSVVVAISVSGAIHTAYFLSLQAGYGCGDLSLVYPLARGTGPLLSTLAAMLLYGERPSGLALAGALLIGVGAFFLAGAEEPQATPSDDGSSKAIVYGLLTGVLIAGYTMWDKYALDVVGVKPAFLSSAANCVRAIGMAPFFLLSKKRRAEVSTAMRTQWKPALIVSISSPLSYLLVLTALATSPVSYVAPAREISILLGTLAGTRMLEEGDPSSRKKRLWASVAMAAGVVALAIG